MTVVMEAFDGCFLDCPVHPLDLTVRPGMIGFRQTMFDPVSFADHVEAHGARPGRIAVTGLISELDAVIGQNGMDPIRNDAQEIFEEFPGDFPIGFLNQLCDSEFAGPIDGDEDIQLAFSSLDLGNIDVKKADGSAFETLSFGLVSRDIRKPGYPVALKAAMQSRACQMRDAGLQGIKTVIQRQQRMPAKGYDHRFVRLGQDRGSRLFGTCLLILNRLTLPPFCNCFRVDPELLAQRRERSLRSL